MDPNDEDDEEYWEYHDFADDELSWPPDGHAASELKQFVADGLDLVLKLKGDRGSKYWPDSSKGAPFLLAEYGLLSFAVVDPLEDSPSFPF
jgi:hypothetical protein